MFIHQEVHHVVKRMRILTYWCDASQSHGLINVNPLDVAIHKLEDILVSDLSMQLLSSREHMCLTVYNRNILMHIL